MNSAQLTGESFLLTLSQIGLGVAGFTALILTLRQESGVSRTKRDTYAIAFILEHSFALVVFSLLPVVLNFSLAREVRVWRISSLALAGFLVLECVVQRVRISEGRRKWGLNPARPWLLIGLFFFPSLCTGALLVLTAFSKNPLAMYSAGLLLLLFQAGIQFWVSLLHYTANSVE